MTREEALERSKYIAREDDNHITTADIEALEMAIEALEQERSRSAEITQYRHDCKKLMEENERLKKALEKQPCEDTISRQAAIDIDFSRICVTCAKPAEVIRQRITNLPSIQPEKICIANITLSEDQLREVVDKAMEELKNSPILIEPEPKIGKWILSGGYWRCSECKEKALLKLDKAKGGRREYEPVRSKHCPSCGTKMEEVKE